MARLRRSLHFVPGANERMLEKSLLSAADSLVLDLEDAVTPDNKDSARATVASWLATRDFGRQERTVRMNPLHSPWGRADLEATMTHPPDAYLVPKAEGLADIEAIDEHLSALEKQYGHPHRGVGLIPIATETPRGVLEIAAIAAHPRVIAITWGAEDLSAALGARQNRDANGRFLPVFEHCRTMALLAGAAAGIPALDTVFVDVRDKEGLEREAREAAAVGWSGKMSIHPAQLEAIHAAFSPSPEEVAGAEALLAAFLEHQAEGRMAFTWQGQMVDGPHLERARRLLERARRTSEAEGTAEGTSP